VVLVSFLFVALCLPSSENIIFLTIIFIIFFRFFLYKTPIVSIIFPNVIFVMIVYLPDKWAFTHLLLQK